MPITPPTASRFEAGARLKKRGEQTVYVEVGNFVRRRRRVRNPAAQKARSRPPRRPISPEGPRRRRQWRRRHGRDASGRGCGDHQRQRQRRRSPTAMTNEHAYQNGTQRRDEAAGDGRCAIGEIEADAQRPGDRPRPGCRTSLSRSTKSRGRRRTRVRPARILAFTSGRPIESTKPLTRRYPRRRGLRRAPTIASPAPPWAANDRRRPTASGSRG